MSPTESMLTAPGRCIAFMTRLIIVICSFYAVSAYSQTLNVRSYGAVGDGVTNDTAAIQSALDAASAGGGGVVYLPAGKYLTDSALLVPSKTHLKGDGRGRTVIVSPAGDYRKKSVNGASIYGTVALVAVDRAMVSDLTVDHLANGTTANGVVLMPDGAAYDGTVTTNSVVQNVEVLGYSSHQYLIWNLRGQNNKIINNYIDGGIPSASTYPQEGIEIFGGQDVLVSGNTVKNVGNNGIYVSSFGAVPGTAVKGILVTDNYVEKSTVGVYLSVDTFDATQIHIQNNIIRDTWSSGVAVTTGTAVATKDIAISGNTILNTVDEGIHLYGSTGATYSNLDVSNNIIDTVTDSSSSGITILAVANTTARRNTIKNTTFGMYVAVSSSNIDILNNRIEEQTKNAVLISGAVNVEVANNRFKNYDKAGQGLNHGIYVENLTTGRITGNEFKYATTESYAVWVQPSASNVQIARNILNYTPAITPPFKNNGASALPDIFYGDVLLPTTSTGLILKEVSTGKRYRVKVTNGVPGIDLVP